MPPRYREESVGENFHNQRCDYAAMNQSRYRRTRRGLNPMGSGADYHIRDEGKYLRLIEQWRAYDRDDLVAGGLVDTAMTAWLRTGFNLDPKTGDKQLDVAIYDRMEAWSIDADACDLAGEHDFRELEFLTGRAMLGDGDILALPMHDGQLQMIENHRLRTPQRMRRGNIINGIQIEPTTRKRLAYFICPDDVDPLAPSPKLAECKEIASRDAEGFRQVFHVYRPSRCTQSRGVTAFAPMFDALGMIEDINFARLVQQQMVSCWGIFRKQGLAGQLSGIPAGGSTTTNTRADGSIETIQGIAPGMDILGRPGEDPVFINPNVPGTGYFEQIKFILQLVSVRLGLPLVLALLDAKETNYSGWRGAVESAREGFRKNQQRMIARFHRPIYLWKLRQFAAEDPAMARAMASNKLFFNHQWQTPEWPYIDPTKDIAADVAEERFGQNSPRRIQGRKGRDFQEIATETIEDNSFRIRAAIEEAKKISLDTGVEVHWREVLALPGPDGVKLTLDDPKAEEKPARSDVGSPKEENAAE